MPADGTIIPPENRSITPVDAVQAARPFQERSNQDKERKERHAPKKVRDYFRPLSMAVDASNRRLAERGLPYRFQVFKKWGEVYIEMAFLDEAGNIKEKQRKNISQNDFIRIIEDVTQIEGMFFDHTV